MINISGDSLHLVCFYIDLDGLVHFGTNTEYSSSYYTMHFKEWLNNIHSDDIEKIESTIYQLFISEISSATEVFRRRNIDDTYATLTCHYQTSKIGKNRIIIGEQKPYTQNFNIDLHIPHQHWINSPYYFYHYKKLLDDMTGLTEKKTLCTLFYFNLRNLKTLVNQHGFDILDKIYAYVFNAFTDFEIYPLSRYQSVLGNFVIIIGRSLTTTDIEQICHKILFPYYHSSPIPIVAQCQTSIGVVTLPSSSDTPRNILRDVARTSEYALHKTDKKWAIYESTLNTQIKRHFFIEKELRNSIQNDELSVIFQPIINATSKVPCSVEILSRWTTHAQGEIFPDEFIPIAESQHLIKQLGWQVLNKACLFLNLLPKHSLMNINVNVSALQLEDSHFATKALQIVQAQKISPTRIIIEITESRLLDSNSLASMQIKKLSQLGFKLSLDDFGSGYSTLNSLFSLPINQIKLDKETANQALQNKEAMNYVRFLVDMCQRNNVEFLVEGIETLEMSERYIKQNVHCLQGFYFAKPMNSKNAIHFIKKNSPNRNY